MRKKRTKTCHFNAQQIIGEIIMVSHATGDGHIPSRDANKSGLKRIMTVGGVYGTRNYTVKDLRDQKGKEVLTETVPFSVEEAAAAEEAGIDTM